MSGMKVELMTSTWTDLRLKSIQIMKIVARCLFGVLGLTLLGCTSAENEMAGGNIMAVNHTLKGINWVSVNGWRAHGGGGRSCCLALPTLWRPGMQADIEWEADPDPYASSPPLGTDEFRAFMVKHEANYQRHSVTVDIPEWQGKDSCDFKVHFLVCNKIKVSTSCWATSAPGYPIKEARQMKEPSVCPK